MAKRTCEHCETEFAIGGHNSREKKQSSARFCSEQCRYDAHNQRRQITRAQKRALGAFNDILEVLTADSSHNADNKRVASQLLVAIREDVRAKVGTKWVCDNGHIWDAPKSQKECPTCKRKSIRLELPKF